MFFAGDIEQASRDELRTAQFARLRRQLERVTSDSPFYRKRFADADFEPGDLDAWDALTFTTKDDVRESVEANPPYGELLAIDPKDLARIHFSSGTTGEPTPMGWSRRDLDTWADQYGRFMWAQGLRPGGVVQVAYSYSWFVGGLGATAGVHRAGATVIPAGSSDTERQVDVIWRYGTTNLVCTPSFALHIAERAEELGHSPMAASSVVGVHVGGEPGASLAATRRRIEQLWGAKCFDCYGSLEFQPIAWECEAQEGPHLPEDHVFAEVVDGETGRPVPPGTEGVLVLTHLDREAMPLVRWWTGDVVVLTEKPCVCGRTHARLEGGVRGRADEMLIIRGVNVFPSGVEQVLRTIEAAGPEFRLVVPADRTKTQQLHILVASASAAVDADDLARQVVETVRQRLSVRPRVDVLPPGSLERATHKATRFVDLETWRKRWASD